jgi:hypothetical protein
LSVTERSERIRGVSHFLRHSLVPHAEAQEAILYPEWNRLVGFPHAAEPMIHDHRAIMERIERLGRADVEDVDLLQELLYGLHALISVHFAKEEELPMPAFDAAPAEATAEVMRRMQALGARDHG